MPHLLLSSEQIVANKQVKNKKKICFSFSDSLDFFNLVLIYNFFYFQNQVEKRGSNCIKDSERKKGEKEGKIK